MITATFLTQWLADLKLPEECIKTEITRVTTRDGEPHKETLVAEWFKQDENGNITILYKDLDGTILKVRPTGLKGHKDFTRTCLSPKMRDYYTNQGTHIKYLQPRDTGTQVFVTDTIIETYLAETKIPTLYLFEGEKKSFKTWWHGRHLPIMGIGGKDNFMNAEKDNLHDAIVKYCKMCRPDNIVLMLDNDLFNMGTFQPDKDVANRLKGFADAVIRFREHAKNHCTDVYLSHPSEHLAIEKYLDQAIKGIDDLLCAYRPELVVPQISMLTQHNATLEFFKTYNIRNLNAAKIYDLFFLNFQKGVPQNFYLHFKDLIKGEFVFRGGRYHWDEPTETLKIRTHPESYSYVRLADNYAKFVNTPNPDGTTTRCFIPWKKSEIIADYCKLPGYENFFNTIKKYDGVCNIPEHDPLKYQQEIHNHYNLYYPLSHEVQEGPWDNIKLFLEHVFEPAPPKDDEAYLGKEKHNKYLLILDWIYLKYARPTQKIPALCLVSEEHKTGKSTFGDIMAFMFQENAVRIGNEDFMDTYNDDYITKNILIFEETLVDKQMGLEKLKGMISNDKANMKTKFVSRKSVPFFASFIINSNYPNKFIRIGQNEDRYWVQYVNPVKGAIDPKLLSKMQDEIPAFLYYLKKEHVMTYKENEDRFYFPTVAYETKELMSLRQQSRSSAHRSIANWIREEFSKYNVEGSDPIYTLNYTQSQVSEAIYKSPSESAKNMEYIKSVLLSEVKIKDPGVRSFKASLPEEKLDKPFDIDIDPATKLWTMSKKIHQGRWFEFRIEKFFSAEELTDLGTSEEKIIEHRALAGEEDTLPF